MAPHRLGYQDRGDGAMPNFAFTEFYEVRSNGRYNGLPFSPSSPRPLFLSHSSAPTPPRLPLGVSGILFYRIRIEPGSDNPDANALLHVGKEGTVIEVTRKPTGEMIPVIVQLVKGWAMGWSSGLPPYALVSAATYNT